MAKFISQKTSDAIKLAKAYQRSYLKKEASTGQINVVSRFSHAGWREVGGKRYYFRSRWESNYARYLQWLKENNQIFDWKHETKTFWFEEIKRGVRSYLPDFLVINFDSSHHWVEVKGYYDSKSLTKIKRFKKYYPKEELVLIDKEWFKKNSKKIKGLILDWE